MTYGHRVRHKRLSAAQPPRFVHLVLADNAELDIGFEVLDANTSTNLGTLSLTGAAGTEDATLSLARTATTDDGTTSGDSRRT